MGAENRTINGDGSEAFGRKSCRERITGKSVHSLPDTAPSDYPAVQKLLKELINEINRIGNNINQIVHGNHMDFYTEADKEQLSAYMRRLNLSMREVIEKIGNQ